MSHNDANKFHYSPAKSIHEKNLLKCKHLMFAENDFDIQNDISRMIDINSHRKTVINLTLVQLSYWKLIGPMGDTSPKKIMVNSQLLISK